MSPSPFPWKCIWKVQIPYRVAFFTWVAVLGKILTTDNLHKRAIIIWDWCCMCKCNGESVDHLLLHCPIASELWDFLFCLVGLDWVMLRTVIAMLASWRGIMGFVEVRLFGVWCLHVSCGVFGEKETVVPFEGIALNLPNLKFSFLKCLYDWNSIPHTFSLSSFLDFIGDLRVTS